MTPQISVQLYSVRELAATDYAGTIRRIADIGFTCVEPAGFPGTTAEAAARLFAELGLKCPSCHGGLPVGEDRNRVIEEAQMLGIEAIITGCPPGFQEAMKDRSAVLRTAELYTEAAAFAADFGIRVGYHNHNWDLAEIEGQPAYRLFLEHTPETVLWEADLFWVARAGLDPAAFVREIGTRGVFLHFKDGQVDSGATFTEAETADGRIMVSSDKPFLPAGTGQVDLKAAYAAAEHVQYSIVELDSYAGDMMNAIAESYAWLTSNGIAKGRK